ncbi:MAG: DUF3293 domain-containing protein [Gammaproteobacteria bacterium]|nr:DUF3293 domain-containing protein [Gammaproteobacteria bacterium]
MSNPQVVDAELHRAFVATRFTVELAGAMHDIRVGEPLPAPLEEYLARVDETDWVYVTAWNPNSVPLPPEENRARQDALRGELESDHAILSGVGIGSDGWSEESLFVAGVEIDEAARIGQAHGQLCVVAGTSGGVARLVYCEGGDRFPRETCQRRA